MKKMVLLTGLVFFLITTMNAQEEPQPQKHENVTWHNVVKVDFKSGKTGRAKEIIKMFEEGGAEAGTKGPEKFWFSTGKYDAMFIWKMEDGPSAMEWSRTADNIKWRKAMIKQLGSEEKLREIQQEYSSLIASSTNEICRKEVK